MNRTRSHDVTTITSDIKIKGFTANDRLLAVPDVGHKFDRWSPVNELFVATARDLHHRRRWAVLLHECFGLCVVRIDHDDAGIVVRPRNRTSDQGEVEDFWFPETISALGGKPTRHSFFNFFRGDSLSLIQLPLDARLLAIHRYQIEAHAVESADYFCSLVSRPFIDENCRWVTIIHRVPYSDVTLRASRMNANFVAKIMGHS